MQPESFRQKLTWKDVFKADFWRYLVKAVWLFFPSILFLVMAWFCFWKITQGKDVMQITLENTYVFAYCIIAQVFWVFITWFTSRIIGKAKMYQQPDSSYIWKRFLTQLPRILAFTCFSIIILAFIQLRADPEEKYPWLFGLLLLLSFPWYFIIYNFWSRRADKADEFADRISRIRYLNSFRYTTYIVLIVSAIIVIFTRELILLLVLLVELQTGLVLLLVFRRKLIFVKEQSFFEKTEEQWGFTKESSFITQTKGLLFDQEDKAYTRAFIYVIVIGLIVYLRTVFSVNFSVRIGAFPFVLLAFGVLLMLGNVVALFSVMKRFNFHMLLLGVAFLIGLLAEPHYTHLPQKKNRAALFSKRQNLKQYFEAWINQRRQILDSSKEKYPVYFVLADGGASRSGYWVASVLAKLEDTTRGEFSKHVFCLSGASGGSVGNAAYFNLLRLRQNHSIHTSGVDVVQSYLGSDFLTYTLARMLGPDVFRHIFPFPFIDDRAASLAEALEHASGKKSMLYDSMSTRFSEIITQQQQNYSLPVLCINTTRMQDGRPGVISTIDISDDRYNGRLDVLDLLTEEEDIKLSTAVVLGASFPYVSPAGRIDSRNNPDSGLQSHYFVDGGYFDNSGAGIVSEMISILLTDSLYLQYKNKLDFYILHINNEPTGGREYKKVNPLVNDLAAPVKTLMGAYGSQTTVNDERLRNFMKTIYTDGCHYRKINLYDDGKRMNYSMNWVISDTLLRAMQNSLEYNLKNNPGLKACIQELK